jgi:hypothetical protein
MTGQFFRWTREGKSIEAMNTRQMPQGQDSKRHNPVQMKMPKALCTHGNRIWESSQLMKEYKSIEVMNTAQMLIPQEPKAGSQTRMRRSTGLGND